MYFILSHQAPELETPSPSATDFTADYSHEFPNGSVVEDAIEPEVGRGGKNRMQVESSKDITSEGMWHRTDVLAGKGGLCLSASSFFSPPF